MMGDISYADQIYIICGATDMRKSIDGLCTIIKDYLALTMMKKGKAIVDIVYCFNTLYGISGYGQFMA